MKKILTIGATLLTGLSLAACSNTASQKPNTKSSSSSVTTTKVVKHHKESKQKASSGSASVSTNSTSTSSTSSQATAQSQNDSSESALDKALNEPYKGYPTYRDYLEANSGDPDVQAQTAKMQHDWNVQQGIENPDGSEKANNNDNQVIRDYYTDDGDTHIVETPNSESITTVVRYHGDDTSEGGR